MASTSSFCTPRTEARIDSVRSLSTFICTPAGSVACSCGSSVRTCSTTAITFAPGWRWMFTSTAGVVPLQAASWRFSAPSVMVATSPRRSGAPSRQASTRERYSSTLRIWSLASSITARIGPSKLPLGRLTLAAAIAVRMWSMPRLFAASAAGFTWMRTAGRWPPARLTKPTPGSCARRCAMRVSTRSCTCGSASACEVTARVRMGVSAGLTLRYTGGTGRSPGRKLPAALMAACTSCSATPRDTSRPNCRVMTEAPPELVDDSCFRPGICPSWRSSGAVMVRVVSSGLAPGYSVVIWMIG